MEESREYANLNEAAVQAYLELLELNMRIWQPEVARWLHSPEAEGPLKQLLTIVPCSPTVH